MMKLRRNSCRVNIDGDPFFASVIGWPASVCPLSKDTTERPGTGYLACDAVGCQRGGQERATRLQELTERRSPAQSPTI